MKADASLMPKRLLLSPANCKHGTAVKAASFPTTSTSKWSEVGVHLSQDNGLREEENHVGDGMASHFL
jgi:hypothetical protein